MNDSTSLIDEIAELIHRWDDVRPTLLGPVAEWMILRAEQELEITFPPSFRCFLKRFGGGLVFDYAILGLVEEPGHWLDIVHVNRLVPRHIPRQYVWFVYPRGDGAYYLDTSRRDARGECPVVVFGPNEECVPVADSFLDFLSQAREGWPDSTSGDRKIRLRPWAGHTTRQRSS